MQRFIKPTSGEIKEDIFYTPPSEMIIQALSIKDAQYDKVEQEVDTNTSEVLKKIESTPETEKYAEELKNKYTLAETRVNSFLQETGDIHEASRALNKIKNEAIKDFSAGGAGAYLSAIKDSDKEDLKKVQALSGKEGYNTAYALYLQKKDKIKNSPDLESAASVVMEGVVDRPEITKVEKVLDLASKIPIDKQERSYNDFVNEYGKRVGMLDAVGQQKVTQSSEVRSQAAILKTVLTALQDPQALAYFDQQERVHNIPSGLTKEGGIDVEGLIKNVTDKKGNVVGLKIEGNSQIANLLRASLQMEVNNTTNKKEESITGLGTAMAKENHGLGSKTKGESEGKGGLDLKGVYSAQTVNPMQYQRNLSVRGAQLFNSVKSAKVAYRNNPTQENKARLARLRKEYNDNVHERQQITGVKSEIVNSSFTNAADKTAAGKIMQITGGTRDLTPQEKSQLINNFIEREKVKMSTADKKRLAEIEKRSVKGRLTSKQSAEIYNIYAKYGLHHKEDSYSTFIDNIESRMQKSFENHKEEINKVLATNFAATPSLQIVGGKESTALFTALGTAINSGSLGQNYTTGTDIATSTGVKTYSLSIFGDEDGNKKYNPVKKMMEESGKPLQTLVKEGKVAVSVNKGSDGQYNFTIDVIDETLRKHANGRSRFTIIGSNRNKDVNQYVGDFLEESTKGDTAYAKNARSILANSPITQANSYSIAMSGLQEGTSKTYTVKDKSSQNFSVKTNKLKNGVTYVNVTDGHNIPIFKTNMNAVEYGRFVEQLKKREDIFEYLETIKRVVKNK